MKMMHLVASVILLLVGCTTTRESRVAYRPEVRKMSTADDTLFLDLLLRVGETDHKFYPSSKDKTLTRIEVITPYDNRKTGDERWFIQHDDGAVSVYRVKLQPDGRGGTRFVGELDPATTKKR